MGGYRSCRLESTPADRTNHRLERSTECFDAKATPRTTFALLRQRLSTFRSILPSILTQACLLVDLPAVPDCAIIMSRRVPPGGRSTIVFGSENSSAVRRTPCTVCQSLLEQESFPHPTRHRTCDHNVMYDFQSPGAVRSVAQVLDS
jgi:hypothetical protein